MVDLLYPKLSYLIVGKLYEVYNELSFGHKEKVYQKAFAELLSEVKIPYKRELYFPILFKEKVMSKYYFDFLINDKIIVELKVANDFYQKDINQLLSYFKHKGYKLGILAIFTKDRLKYKRIANSR